jgi:RNA polymerase sigma-70 factor (sigma-E family)
VFFRQVGEQTAEPEGSAPDALSTAYEHHYAQLVRLCGLLSGSREVAEDIVQTVFVRAASRIAVLPAEEVRPYLRTAVANEWRNHRRRMALDRRVRPRLIAGGRESPSVDQDHDDLWRALFRLPPKQRACLVLRYYEDLSEKQAADVLGVSIGTVKSQTSRALSKMRKELER